MHVVYNVTLEAKFWNLARVFDETRPSLTNNTASPCRGHFNDVAFGRTFISPIEDAVVIAPAQLCCNSVGRISKSLPSIASARKSAEPMNESYRT
jgi:hypothetical protein